MYYFIVNPASRSGRGARLWKETIEPFLMEREVPYEVFFSQKQGDLIAIANKLCALGEISIIIVGGDGTVNEVMQGIPENSTATISYVPTGSSNDLARDLGFSKKTIEILTHLLDHPITSPMDMGILNTPSGRRRFAVSCGIGFDAAVCEEANASTMKDTFNRIGLGKLTYLGIALKQLFKAKHVSCELTLDDGKTIVIPKILFVAMMNHRYEGGGFQFCPTAEAHDGLLDLCVVENLPKFLILIALPTAFFGKHFMFPGITHYRASKVTLHCSAPLWVHTDGEVWEKDQDITVTCAQNYLRFRY